VDFLQKIDNLIEAEATKTAVLPVLSVQGPFYHGEHGAAGGLISVIVMFTSMKKKKTN